MAAFICDRCGKCCVSLGQSITIERQLNDRDYFCRSQIDNATFPVQVMPKFQDEVAEEYLAGDAPGAAGKRQCPFLRKDPPGDGTACAIYDSRPKVCRDFRCYRMVIYDRKDVLCGRVIGKNTIRTEDPALEMIWTGEILSIPTADPAAWSKRVAAVLADHGYRAEPVD